MQMVMAKVDNDLVLRDHLIIVVSQRLHPYNLQRFPALVARIDISFFRRARIFLLSSASQ